MKYDDFRLGKEYKLCSKKIIDSVFNEGNIAKEYPLFMRYKTVELPSPSNFQFIISAPKRKFKRAVKRNRIKRICKEVIRLNKAPLDDYCAIHNYQLALFIVYTGEDELKIDVLTKKYNQLIQKVIKQLDENKIKK